MGTCRWLATRAHNGARKITPLIASTARTVNEKRVLTEIQRYAKPTPMHDKRERACSPQVDNSLATLRLLQTKLVGNKHTRGVDVAQSRARTSKSDCEKCNGTGHARQTRAHMEIFMRYTIVFIAALADDSMWCSATIFHFKRRRCT